jgi:hypothetical protein
MGLKVEVNDPKGRKKVDFSENLPKSGQSGVIIGLMFIIPRMSLFNMIHRR